jgi:hypothetical protein
MKITLASIVGIIIGAAAGLAVLYYNPLTEPTPTPTASGAGRTLHYALPEQSLAFMHGERALPPNTGSSQERFWEETINRAALLALSLNDAQGVPAAAASRLMQTSSDTDLLLTGVLVHDFWLLTFPGEGSVFVRVDSNAWPFLKQSFIPTWYFGRPWQGTAEYRPTVGPGLATALVIGATGRFADLQGQAVEQYRVTGLDPDRRTVTFAGELRLDLQEPALVAGD